MRELSDDQRLASYLPSVIARERFWLARLADVPPRMALASAFEAHVDRKTAGFPVEA